MASLDTLTDAALLDLLKSGDRAAFTEIYQRYSQLIYRHAYKKLGDKTAADELIQELFVHLWEQREKLAIQSNLAGYLYTAIRNRALNYYYKSQRQHLYLEDIVDFVERGEYSTDLAILEQELTQIIEREISQLPERMRTALLMSRRENKSHKEIAEALGTSEHTVSNQISTALRHLKVKLGPLFVLAVLLERL